ncbi:hypothetical protein [Nonomuraea aurantiaca]|nr:hypothetical protein [Nonomuraea aurantiaca]MCA2228735.1 hypothetical protein [Nonomuraea aurantiaca]
MGDDSATHAPVVIGQDDDEAVLTERAGSPGGFGYANRPTGALGKE